MNSLKSHTHVTKPSKRLKVMIKPACEYFKLKYQGHTILFAIGSNVHPITPAIVTGKQIGRAHV